MKIIVRVVAAVVAFVAVGLFFNLKRHSARFEDVLIDVSADINKELPKTLDDDTRLDNTAPGPGRKFTYTYTLVKHEKGDLDLSKLELALRPQIVGNYKTNSEMKTFRDNGAELHYRYNDKSGLYLFEIVVSPKDF